MTNPVSSPALSRWLRGLGLLGASLALACSGTVETPQGSTAGIGGGAGTTAIPGQGGSVTGQGGGVTGQGGSVTGQGGSITGQGGSTATACTGVETVVPKRLVRLTFPQVLASLRALLGDALATQIAGTFEISDGRDRQFPPLLKTTEGATITAQTWQKGDNIAETAGEYVLSNFATVTSCTDAPTAQCGQDFATSFAERAFRRPLLDAERTRLLNLYQAIIGDGGTVQEAVQHSVYGVLEAPQFLYRTEFGGGATAEGPLSQYEMASQLSYFITEGPPDQALLDAAAQGSLASPGQIDAQVTRLVGLDATKRNLEDLIFSYFELFRLDSVVIDQAIAPDWSLGLRDAMYTEGQRFINGLLWTGMVNDLILSRNTNVNRDLANLYGVTPFPPAGATPDADGFAPVVLPEQRAGILTQAGFLAGWSRPDVPSVVGRGLLVNAKILCADNPAFPEELAGDVDDANALLAGASEREKADYRGTTVPCLGCHTSFDAFGLALENFDIIGKYRTADSQGRPIDASVTLPANAGGMLVTSPVEMANQLAATGAFASCVARNMMRYALSDAVPDPQASLGNDGCATRAVADRVSLSTTQSFTDIVREVAKSNTLALRIAGGI